MTQRANRVVRLGDHLGRRSMGVRRARPVLALATTTAPLSDAETAALGPVLDAVVGAVARCRAAIVTGGTEAGVISLLGKALDTGPDLFSVGVVPAGPVQGEDSVALDPHHDVTLVVPGQEWGDETATLSSTVAVLAGDHPTAALLIGGGPGAHLELVTHLGAGRPVLVLAGTGRLADDVAAHRLDDDPELGPLLAGGDVRVVHLDDGPSRIADEVTDLLRRHRGPWRERVPALLVWPRLRVPVADRSSMLGAAAGSVPPSLTGAVSLAERAIAPAYWEMDTLARREQNRHRQLTVLALLGALATTVFGGVQTWLGSVAWPGVVVAVAGAATSALATISRGGDSLTTYRGARVRAERLRALYFEQLARPVPDDEPGRRARARELQLAVTECRYGPVR